VEQEGDVTRRAVTVVTPKKPRTPAQLSADERARRRAELQRKRFLQTLEQTTNVAASCRAAAISRKTAYEWRKVFSDFAEEWDAALNAALDQLEQTAIERAHSGSDLLMMFLLKANRPEKYRETVTHEARGEVRVVFTNDWRGRNGQPEGAAEGE
jgi:hypothetical protein